MASGARLFRAIDTYGTLAVWLLPLHLSVLLLALCLLYLPRPPALVGLAVMVCCELYIHCFYLQEAERKASRLGVRYQAVLTFLPLRTPGWALELRKHILKVAATYFPVHLVFEDESAVNKEGEVYIGCLEPHNVLPLSVCALNPLSIYSERLRTTSWRKAHYLATYIIFRVPLLRQIWYWMGLRSVGKRTMSSLLHNGHSVVLTPGGVSECLHMTKSKETVFLRKRLGLAKMALQQGAHLVPMYAFGQRNIYNFWKVGPPVLPNWIVRRFSKVMGFAPIIFWGRWGTPLPRRSEIHVVVGKPVFVEHDPNPSEERIHSVLNQFVHEIQALYERHKAKYGHENIELEVI